MQKEKNRGWKREMERAAVWIGVCLTLTLQNYLSRFIMELKKKGKCLWRIIYINFTDVDYRGSLGTHYLSSLLLWPPQAILSRKSHIWEMKERFFKLVNLLPCTYLQAHHLELSCCPISHKIPGCIPTSRPVFLEQDQDPAQNGYLSWWYCWPLSTMFEVSQSNLKFFS